MSCTSELFRHKLPYDIEGTNALFLRRQGLPPLYAANLGGYIECF